MCSTSTLYMALEFGVKVFSYCKKFIPYLIILFQSCSMDSQVNNDNARSVVSTLPNSPISSVVVSNIANSVHTPIQSSSPFTNVNPTPLPSPINVQSPSIISNNGCCTHNVNSPNVQCSSNQASLQMNIPINPVKEIENVISSNVDPAQAEELANSIVSSLHIPSFYIGSDKIDITTLSQNFIDHLIEKIAHSAIDPATGFAAYHLKVGNLNLLQVCDYLSGPGQSAEDADVYSQLHIFSQGATHLNFVMFLISVREYCAYLKMNNAEDRLDKAVKHIAIVALEHDFQPYFEKFKQFIKFLETKL